MDGNHENHRLLAALPERPWRGGRVHEVRPHVLHLMRGHVFALDGVSVFALGGAASHDRRFRREGVDWWQEEEVPGADELALARESLKAHGRTVDYVVTHEAPADIAETLAWECGRPYDPCDPLRAFLQEVDDQVSFRTWFFGHYHDDEWRDGRHRLIYRDVVPIGVRRGDEDREPV